YDASELAAINHKSIRMMVDLRDQYQTPDTPCLISGCIGPRGDGYTPTERMTAQQARDYHAVQVRSFSGTPVDMVSAFTMNYPEEAIGIAQACKDADMPCVI